MKNKVIIILVIVLTLLIGTGLITSYIDSARVRNSIEPKFTIKIVTEQGNKVTYLGLGYKVIRYPSVSPNEPYKNNLGVKYGGWFMKYELKDVLEDLKRKEYELNIDIEKLNDPEYLAKYIKEKYMYSKDGEIIEIK